jgi:hypothetical protein
MLPGDGEDANQVLGLPALIGAGSAGPTAPRTAHSDGRDAVGPGRSAGPDGSALEPSD